MDGKSRRYGHVVFEHRMARYAGRLGSVRGGRGSPAIWWQ
jgi:hypothetical protein